jgi:predicted short-subunit dehydrogenase-like oxidoreductase (DUF2520 family)
MGETVALIGAGAVGRAVGRLLARAGYPIGPVVCRSEARAREAVAFIGAGTPSTDPDGAAGRAALVLLGLPDEAIEPMARRLRTAARVVHFSGTLPASLLAPCGGPVGAIHPLRSFADPAAAAADFAGTYCFIEGEEPAVLERIVRDLAGRPVRVEAGRKALYHAGAVFASNYVVALFELAVRLLEAAGVPRAEAAAPLAGLLEGTAANLRRVGLPGALTGPIARGEAATLRAHLAVLEDPELAALYRSLGRVTLEVARARGLAPEAAERIERLLA